MPVSTGAARATRLVLPAMKGRLDGTALRVPVPAGSITDFTAVVHGSPSVAEVNAAFAEAAAKPPLDRVLEYTEDPIVSSDIVGSPASCTFDAGLTMVQSDQRRHVHGQGAGLVRQRVGLLEPTGRPDRAGRGLTGMNATARAAAPRGPPRPRWAAGAGAGRLQRPAPHRDRRAGHRGRRLPHQGRPAHAALAAGPGGRGRGLLAPGPPADTRDPRWEMDPVRERLAALCPGVELGENLRFDPGEKANDPAFVAPLIEGFDAYVNEAFGVAHRRHASIVGPPQFLPSAAGLRLASEVEVLGGSVGRPGPALRRRGGRGQGGRQDRGAQGPGAQVDTLIVGGGMAFTFLAALGHRVGSSLFDPEQLADCRALLDSGLDILLPTDIRALEPGGTFGRPADGVGPRGGIKVIERDLPDGWTGLDIGPESAATFADVVSQAGHRALERPAGCLRGPPLRRRHACGGPGGGRVRRLLGRGWRRQRQRPRRARAWRPGELPLHRWRGVARLHRADGDLPALERPAPRARTRPLASGRPAAR